MTKKQRLDTTQRIQAVRQLILFGEEAFVNYLGLCRQDIRKYYNSDGTYNQKKIVKTYKKCLKKLKDKGNSLVKSS